LLAIIIDGKDPLKGHCLRCNTVTGEEAYSAAAVDYAAEKMADRTGLLGLSCPRPAGHPQRMRLYKIVPDNFVEPFKSRPDQSVRQVYSAAAVDYAAE
jgi:hypothetical protein